MSIIFSDHPEFTPNLTPQEMFKLGIFGGSYYRDIHSSITGQDYTNQWKEFDWTADISPVHPLNLIKYWQDHLF